MRLFYWEKKFFFFFDIIKFFFLNGAKKKKKMMVKKIILLMIFIYVAYSSVIGRGIATTSISLEYLGSCQEFSKDLTTVWISSFNDGECLPISTNPATFQQDINDLTATNFCVKITETKSIINFVGISTSFAFSFIPSHPFRATNTQNYVRRPSCLVKSEFMRSFSAVVSCTNVSVEIESDYVVSHDRIYILPENTNVTTCLNDSICCPYIASSENFGICPNYATTNKLPLAVLKKNTVTRPHNDKYQSAFNYDTEYINGQTQRVEEVKKNQVPKKPLGKKVIIEEIKLPDEKDEEEEEVEEKEEQEPKQIKKQNIEEEEKVSESDVEKLGAEDAEDPFQDESQQEKRGLNKMGGGKNKATHHNVGFHKSHGVKVGSLHKMNSHKVSNDIPYQEDDIDKKSDLSTVFEVSQSPKESNPPHQSNPNPPSAPSKDANDQPPSDFNSDESEPNLPQAPKNSPPVPSTDSSIAKSNPNTQKTENDKPDFDENDFSKVSLEDFNVNPNKKAPTNPAIQPSNLENKKMHPMPPSHDSVETSNKAFPFDQEDVYQNEISNDKEASSEEDLPSNNSKEKNSVPFVSSFKHHLGSSQSQPVNPPEELEDDDNFDLFPGDDEDKKK